MDREEKKKTEKKKIPLRMRGKKSGAPGNRSWIYTSRYDRGITIPNCIILLDFLWPVKGKEPTPLNL